MVGMRRCRVSTGRAGACSCERVKPSDRYVIYCWTHVVTGRKYVGQSYRERQRATAHARGSGSMYFQRAILKYGIEAFRFEVLDVLPMAGAVPTEARRYNGSRSLE